MCTCMCDCCGYRYFKHNQLYGLSCYEKISVDSVEERGARMRSVGILAVGYSDLHMHKEFLQEQARYVCWWVNAGLVDTHCLLLLLL